MVLYTERIVRVCVGLFLVAYGEYRFLNVPLDVLWIFSRLGMDLEVPLGSVGFLRECSLGLRDAVHYGVNAIKRFTIDLARSDAEGHRILSPSYRDEWKRRVQ